jgi:G3E family GTPase
MTDRARHTDAAGGGPVPVTILTGFLGSGKTTLLNRLLSTAHGLRIGIIVNEFGAVGIDEKLISRQNDGVIELANGCVCCTMAGDLTKSLARLVTSGAAIDYVLIETTGLADPAPVAATLCHGELASALRLDSIVTVVDSYNFDANLDRAEAAFSQLVNADILLINKIDLVGEEIPDLVEAGIRRINDGGRFLRSAHAQVDPRLILGVDLFRLKADLDAKESAHGHHHGEGGHNHLEGFESLAIRATDSLDADRFIHFADAIPSSVFRAKGIVDVAGSANRHIFHLVGDRRTVVQGDPWQDGEARQTDLVLIGRSIDGESLSAGLEACVRSPA